jgi:hypothetical protein
VAAGVRPADVSSSGGLKIEREQRRTLTFGLDPTPYGVSRGRWNRIILSVSMIDEMIGGLSVAGWPSPQHKLVKKSEAVVQAAVAGQGQPDCCRG